MRILQLKRAWPVFLSFGVSISSGLLPQSVLAGDWVFDHSTTLKVSHVDRSGNDGYSGQTYQATPNLHLHGEGGRFKADINYRPTITEGTGSTDPELLTHNLNGKARLEAVEDVFFIGADSTASLTGNSNTNSSTNVDAINFNSEGGQQVFTFGITPEFRHHLNRYADIVSSNRLDWVTYSGNSDQNGSNDSRGQTTNIQIRNGRHFTKFDWSLNATQRKTFYDSNQDDDTRRQYTFNLGYRFNQRWAVNGSAGHEDNDVNNNASNTNGTIWDVGATWTPNPRTSVSAEYGDRYFGERFAGSVSHQTRRIRLGLDFSREVETRRDSQLYDSFFFLADSDGSPVLDPSTGSPIIVNNPEERELDEEYISTRVNGIVTITGRRTNVTITGYASRSDYEDSPFDEDTYGLTVRTTRDLGSNYNASLTGRVQHAKDDLDGDNTTSEIGFTLSKALSPRSRAALDLGFRDYDDDRPGENYTEKRIGISFTTTYL